MARQLQLRRGTTSEHSTFTGAAGEVTVDTVKNVPVVHDGVTAGGFAAARESVVNTKVEKNADIVAGTATKVTYDSKGLVTSGSNPTTLNGYGITDVYTKTEVDTKDAVLQTNINTEKSRIDAILAASTADKDSFAEIVDLINSVDTTNDNAFAGYVLSNDAAVALKAPIDNPTFTGTVTAPTFSGSLSGNASTATKLATARTISTSGDVTTTAQSFDGSANITIPMTLATVTDSGIGTFKKVTVDTKGRVTGTQAVTQSDITGLLGAGSITNTMLANTAVANLSGVNTGDQINITGNAGTATRVKVEAMTSGMDLNNFVTTGLYGQYSNDNAASGTNYPTATSGLLEVITDETSSNFVYQRYWAYNSTLMWYRTKYNTTWGNWVLNAMDVTVDSTAVGSIRYNGVTPIAGAFSGGTTAPLIVDNRLNYSGYFHPTYINLSASADTATASSHYYVETASDGFVRPKTLANVRAEIITKAALLSADPYYFNSGIGTSGIAATTHYPIFPTGSDTLTLGVGTYKVKLCMIATVATSTVSSALLISMRGAGTAAGTHYGVLRYQTVNGGSPIQSVYLSTNISTNLSMTSASAVAGRVYQIDVDMIMNITTAGTIIPSYQWSAALTSGVVTLSAANYIIIDKMAETSVTTAGGWV